jgi:hypothetical protein
VGVVVFYDVSLFLTIFFYYLFIYSTFKKRE